VKSEFKRDQAFQYYVKSGESCRNQTDDIVFSKPRSHLNRSNFRIKANSNTLIYSDNNQTLSFFIEIIFKISSSSYVTDVHGFELEFKSNNQNITSCIQIIALNPQFSFASNVNYRLTIKDPSFLSQNNIKYIFYFGQIVVRALVKCKSPDFCSSNVFTSENVEIGIKSLAPFNTTLVEADACDGHVIEKTCIIKLPPENTPSNKTHYIIIHPIPEGFNQVEADLNIFKIEPDVNAEIMNAFKLKKSTLWYKNIYFNLDNFDPFISITDKIVSSVNERFPNGLVFKLVDHSEDDVFYMSVLKEPNELNPCNNLNDKHSICYCKERNDACANKCFSMDSPENKYPYLAIMKNQTNTLKSTTCNSSSYFRAFDFEDVKLKTTFQNSELKNDFNTIKSFYNRDYLPRVCLSLSMNINNLYNLKIKFQDYHKTGISSVLEQAQLNNYSIRIYSFEMIDNRSNETGSGSFFTARLNTTKVHIDSEFILNIKNQFIIENLPESKYVLEIIPANNNDTICPAHFCIDEDSNRKNKIKCIRCNKLFLIFEIHSQTNKSANNKKNNDHTQVKLKINNLKDYTSDYICSFDDEDYQTIFTNHFYNNEAYMKYPVFKKDKILNAAIVPVEFSIPKYLIVPANQRFIYKMSLEQANAGNPKQENKNILLTLLITSMSSYVIYLCLLLLALPVISIRRNLYKLGSIEKKIVFYLSIDINHEQQNELAEFVNLIRDKLKKTYSKAKVDVITYALNSSQRLNLINNAELILYVCCSKKELDKLKLRKRFGYNDYNHDYNRLHYQPGFKNKTLNIVFTKTNLNDYNNAPESTSNGISEVPINNSDSRWLFGQTECLVLPFDIKKLIQRVNPNEMCNPNDSNRLKNLLTPQGFHKFIFDFIIKYRESNLNKIIEKMLKKNTRVFNSSEDFDLYDEHEKGFQVVPCQISVNDSDT